MLYEICLVKNDLWEICAKKYGTFMSDGRDVVKYMGNLAHQRKNRDIWSELLEIPSGKAWNKWKIIIL